MELTERLVEMSRTEVDNLRKLNRLPPVFFIIQAVFWGIWLWLLFNSETPLGVKILFGLFIPIFLIVANYMVYRHKRWIRRDLQSGKKKLIRGHIEGKRESSAGYSSVYFLTLCKQEFAVPFSQWQHTEANQLVELHLAVFSKHIFGVYPVESE